MNATFIKKWEYVLNALEILGVLLLLLMAFGFQFIFNELPCPLCLLQRVGFIGIACGFLLNLRFGLKSSHYAIALLFAFFTAMVALRQVALHAIPGSGSYGSAVFGLHMYTWSFIVSVVVLVFTTIMLGMDSQYYSQQKNISNKKTKKIRIMHFLFCLVAVVILSNIVSVYFECGLTQCPDNPIRYLK